MKNILIFILFLSLNITFAQEYQSFYIEIPDKNNIPIVTYNRKGIRMTYSKTANSSLNKLLNSYEIYSCKKVFTQSKKLSLQNIYLIECNDLKLMDDLFEKFKQIYPRVENAKGVSLATPNDYSSTGGYLGNQAELDYIRAPETWDLTTGSSDIIIGISDTNFTPEHEDLLNTLSVEVNASANNLNEDQHGSRVSSFAAANTNNGKGMASIGYNSNIYAGVDLNASIMDELSLKENVKVLNASWYSAVYESPPTITNSVYDEIVEDRKVVVIVAAGNGNSFNINGNPNYYFYPASYKNVISVSSIGHVNKTFWDRETFIDEHEYLKAGITRTHQHNDSIDIVAPGYGMLSVNPNSGTGLSSYSTNRTGTSYSAPMVAGTVALMFDVNYCIDPKEVETILKLTAVKIDNLPQNIQYYGKLGAGRLDAYEAVKMAKDMADPFGTVEVKNRILYRPWFYKLETAPYEIKMTNNDVTGGSKLKFKARSNIEILSGDYYPSTGGYIDLSVNSTLALDCPPPQPSSGRNNVESKTETNYINGAVLENNNDDLLVFPNPTKEILNIGSKDDLDTISISDITGKVIYYIKDINKKELKINMTTFNSGMYFAKIKIKTGEITSVKIIKE